MLRWNHTMVVVALATLLCPSAVYAADEADITGSSLVFQHDPVIPPDQGGGVLGSDPDGNDAFVYEVSGPFFGELVTKKTELPFTGTGDAVVYVYLDPIPDPIYGWIVATFSGSFTWETAQGEITGTFAGIEYPYVVGETPVEGVFSTVIFIEFNGGTGKYKKATGEAVAEGLDYPFGGLGPDGSLAGVLADIVQGELKKE